MSARWVCTLGLLGALSLGACDAKRPPAEEVVEAQPLQEEALPGQPEMTRFKRSAKDRKALEAAALLATPKLARREGKTLKGFIGERLAFVGSDLDCTKVDSEECESFIFVGPIRLLSSQTGKVESYPLIQHNFIESAIFHIPINFGKTFDINEAGLASPDGRLIAAGADTVDEMNGDSALTLYDWVGQKPLVTFDVSCQPNVWIDNNSLSVLCMVHEEGIDVFEGLLTRSLTGSWTLKATRKLDPTTYIPLPPDKQVLKTYAARDVTPHQAAAD